MECSWGREPEIQFCFGNLVDQGRTQEKELPIEHLERVVTVMIAMHSDVEVTAQGYLNDTGHYVYVSPQLFENFLRTYKRLLKMRIEKLQRHRERFRKGYEGILKCLRETEAAQEILGQRAP